MLLINKAVHEVDTEFQIGRSVSNYFPNDCEKKTIEVMTFGMLQALPKTSLGACLRDINITPIGFPAKGWF